MKKHPIFSYTVCLGLGIFGCTEASTTHSETDPPQDTSIEQPANHSTCQDACDRDICDGIDAVFKCMDTNDDGCKDAVRAECPQNSVCSDGVCKAADVPCENACTEGSECDGDKLKTCKDNDGDGCKEWVVEDCPDNTACDAGLCKDLDTACENTCTDGVECDGTSRLKTCKDDNGDGCKEWVIVDCPDGKTCSDGACRDQEPTCEDTCSGSTTCEGTSGYKTCEDTNNDGCKEWSEVTACPSGQTCSEGRCAVPACKYTKAEDPGIHPLPSESKSGTSESVTTNGYTDEYLYDASDYIKIGARREWGGSIIFFGLADGNKGTNGTNTIDGNDTGREVQVAIYDSSRLAQNCAYNASCQSNGSACPNSITYLGWNPVQGGNRCNIGSNVDSVNNKNGIMEIVTTPLHWNPNWDAADCTSNGCSTSLKDRKSDVRLTQRLRFVNTHVVELFYSLTNLADMSHTKTSQELPTMYAAYGAHGLGNYNRLMNADKTEIKIDQPGNDGFYYKHFTSSAPWVTLQNNNLDYGVGILYENGLLKYTGWQKANVFNNVRSGIEFGLPPHGTVNARAYLILGSFDMVKTQAEWLIQSIPPFGALDFPAENESVSGTSVTVSGWALDNSKVSKVEALIDESTTVKLTYGSSRPDVCDVWVGYPACNNVGYSGTIDVSGLDKNCKHLLEIVATDDKDNKRTIARRLLTVQ